MLPVGYMGAALGYWVSVVTWLRAAAWAGKLVVCRWEAGGVELSCRWRQGEKCAGVGWCALGSGYIMIYLICLPLCLPSRRPTASHTYQGSYHIKNSLSSQNIQWGYEIFTHEAPDDEVKRAQSQALAETSLLWEQEWRS